MVKNHGKTDFEEISKKRSRRTHRSNKTEPISTEPLLSKKQERKSDGDFRYRVTEREVIIF